MKENVKMKRKKSKLPENPSLSDSQKLLKVLIYIRFQVCLGLEIR